MVVVAKIDEVKRLNESFSTAKVAVFANFSGVTVEQVDLLRKDLREASASLKVVKNTLARIAIDETSMESAKSLLKGPVVVVLGYGEEIGPPAKIILEFAKTNNKSLNILGGVVEGSFIDAAGVKQLGDLPSKPVVQAMLLGLLQAPARNVMGLMTNSARKFLYLLNALAEKKTDES